MLYRARSDASRQRLRLGVVAQFGRQLRQQSAAAACAASPCGGTRRSRSCACGSNSWMSFCALADLGQVAAAASPRALQQVDLEHERVAVAELRRQHALQRRVRHHAAVPVALAVDLDRRRTRAAARRWP